MPDTPPGSGAPNRRLIAVWIVWIGLVAFWAAVAIGLAGLSAQVVGPRALWALSIIITITLLALAGREVNGQWFGVLIDTRNKLSLARLQIAVWTVMVLTAYLTIALLRVAAMGDPPNLSQAQVLEISFPPELILAMGISAVSFAGAALIKSNKTSKTITIEARSTPEAAQARRDQAKAEFTAAESKLLEVVQDEATKKQAADAAAAAVTAAGAAVTQALADALAQAKTLAESAALDKEKASKDRDAKKKALQTAEEDLTAITAAQGLLHRNADPSEAKWVDLFRGEEIGNYKLVDMSKVQMLFFTIVVIVTYAAAIAGMLTDADKLVHEPSLRFPDFSETLTALLGISHGTYLSVKTVDHP